MIASFRHPNTMNLNYDFKFDDTLFQGLDELVIIQFCLVFVFELLSLGVFHLDRCTRR